MTKSSGSVQGAGRCDGGILLEEVADVYREERREEEEGNILVLFPLSLSQSRP